MRNIPIKRLDGSTHISGDRKCHILKDKRICIRFAVDFAKDAPLGVLSQSEWRCMTILHITVNKYLSISPIERSANNTDRHDITELLLKVALNTITLTQLSVDWALVLSFFYQSTTNALEQYRHNLSGDLNTSGSGSLDWKIFKWLLSVMWPVFIKTPKTNLTLYCTLQKSYKWNYFSVIVSLLIVKLTIFL